MFRYDFNFILDIDYPNIKKTRSSNGSINIDCPFCGRKGHMNINVQKSIFRCVSCTNPIAAKGAGMLAFHQIAKGFANMSEAKRDLERRYDGLSVEERESVQSGQTSAKEMPPAKLDYRNDVYKNYLDCMSLSDKHYSDLIARGFKPEWISELGYKTLSAGSINVDGENVTYAEYALLKASRIRFATEKETLSYIRACFNLLGSDIAGFYGKNNRVYAVIPRRPCFLIPCRWRNGEISFLHPRNDDLSPEEVAAGKKLNKYTRFSSGWMETGCSSSGLESIHHAGFDFGAETTPHTVWLTEGVLKADLASKLSSLPFIALVGVSNTSQLADELQYLRKHGTKEIKIAIDMDYREKPDVAIALKNICQIVIESGLKGAIKEWDSVKGIDDYFVLQKNR